MSPLVVNLLKVGLVVVIYLFLAVVVRAVRSQVGTPSAKPASGRDKAPPAPVLVVLAPETIAGRQVEVRGAVVVGRGESADLRIDDGFASDRHARLENEGGRVFVADLGSTNGTYVNGDRISERTGLKTGDTVRVGGTIMEAR